MFTDEEKLLIQDSYDAELGTTDKVFLLSLEEAKFLIGFDEYGAGTPYALASGLDTATATSDGYSSWLTRSCDEGKIGHHLAEVQRAVLLRYKFSASAQQYGWMRRS